MGQRFQILAGGPESWKFNEAVSFVVESGDQAETDRLWEALTANGGEPGPCGWLKDRYGVSWQITPARLVELLNDPDPERARRAMEAMLQMGKIEIAELERAAAAA
jgi:predicted 3-demethylubiquinone-9 3-methyltransferase (glyoxalase superfamily)